MKGIMKKAVFLAAAGMTALALSGCSAGSGGKRIVRISHAQSETHPEHLGLLAFKEYVEERLGDKYEVQIFPNELLGSAQQNTFSEFPNRQWGYGTMDLYQSLDRLRRL